ncbi:MAG: GtrA family protein [Caulobacteraceae bacterium]
MKSLRDHSVLKFSAVGVINTLLDITVFTAMVSMTPVQAYAAQAAGYAAGMLNSFMMNKIWTFRKPGMGRYIAGEALRFFAVNAASLLVSAVLMWFLTDTLRVQVFLSKAVILAVTQVINYTGYRFWVFS